MTYSVTRNPDGKLSQMKRHARSLMKFSISGMSLVGNTISANKDIEDAAPLIAARKEQ